MNPAEKRLAVAVDDHPLEYGDFEGIIPEGRYGAGPVVIWDAGIYEPLEAEEPAKQLQRGSMKLKLDGRTLRGAFALIKLKGPRTTGKEWLLMKTDDGYADPTFTLRSALSPAKRRALQVVAPPCEAS